MILARRLLANRLNNLYITLNILLYIIRKTNSKEVLRIKPKIYYSNTKTIIILRINSKEVAIKIIYNRLILKL